jgi:thymidine kinase
MFSGKSKYLISKYTKNSIVFLPTNIKSLKSRAHVNEIHNVRLINSLDEITDITNSRILIDEFQFFKNNNIEIIRKLKLSNEVFIAGLIQGCEQSKFGEIRELLHIANVVIHLKATCNNCGSNDAINHKLEELINDDYVNAKYGVFCDKCFYTS